MKKLWIAERHVDYEGDDILGIFTTKKRAIAECQAYDDGFGYEDSRRELDFRERNPAFFEAHGQVFEYYVRQVEINTPLMRRDSPEPPYPADGIPF
jgi:hypothetical protein